MEYTHGEIVKSLTGNNSGLFPLSQVLPLWLFKMAMAVMSTALGTLFVLPCIHFAWMQYQLVNSSEAVSAINNNPQIHLLLPDSMHSRCGSSQLLVRSSNRLTNSPTKVFDLLRIVIVLTYCLLRFCFFSTYIQTHFDKSKKCVSILAESKASVGELRNQISNPYRCTDV